MLMMTPDSDFFRCGIASLVTLNVPVRLSASTASHASGSIFSTGAVGPAMPPLFTSTSIPPSISAAAATKRSTEDRSERSQTLEVIVGWAWVTACRVSSLMSQMCTLAPCAAKARAIDSPIPAAPAVTITRLLVVIGSSSHDFSVVFALEKLKRRQLAGSHRIDLFAKAGQFSIKEVRRFLGLLQRLNAQSLKVDVEDIVGLIVLPSASIILCSASRHT